MRTELGLGRSWNNHSARRALVHLQKGCHGCVLQAFLPDLSVAHALLRQQHLYPYSKGWRTNNMMGAVSSTTIIATTQPYCCMQALDSTPGCRLLQAKQAAEHYCVLTLCPIHLVAYVTSQSVVALFQISAISAKFDTRMLQEVHKWMTRCASSSCGIHLQLLSAAGCQRPNTYDIFWTTQQSHHHQSSPHACIDDGCDMQHP